MMFQDNLETKNRLENKMLQKFAAPFTIALLKEKEDTFIRVETNSQEIKDFLDKQASEVKIVVKPLLGI